MSFNHLKSIHMRFGSSSTNFTYSLNNCSIQTKSSHSDVGILLTNTLSWSPHISNILSKAYRSLGLTRQTVPYCSTISLKRSLYLTLVRCHLAYCPQIWRPHLVQDSRAIERLQCRATKYIIAADMDYKSKLANLSLLPLTLWLEFLDILLIKLLQNHPDNFNISNFIVPASSTSTESFVYGILSHPWIWSSHLLPLKSKFIVLFGITLPPIIAYISLAHGIFVAHALLALHRRHMYPSGLIGKRLWTFKSCVNSCFPYNISLSL